MWYNVRLLENVIIHLLETMHVKTEKDVMCVDLLSWHLMTLLTAVLLLDKRGTIRFKDIAGTRLHRPRSSWSYCTCVTWWTLHKLKSHRFDPLGTSLQWVALRHGKIRLEIFDLISRIPWNFNTARYSAFRLYYLNLNFRKSISISRTVVVFYKCEDVTLQIRSRYI